MTKPIMSLQQALIAAETDRLHVGLYRSFAEDADANANITISCATLAEAIVSLYAVMSIPGVNTPEHIVFDPRNRNYGANAKDTILEADSRRLDILIGQHIDGYLRFFRQLVLCNNVRLVALAVGLQKSTRIQLSACFRLTRDENNNTRYTVHYSLSGGTQTENAWIFKDAIAAISNAFERTVV